MNPELGVFYFFSAVLILAGLRVITARNPVHAALFLVLAFFTAAGIWILLQAEFLAIVLVLVYVGAVMVLFLFVVMMLDVNSDRLKEGYWDWLVPGLIVAGTMVFEMLIVLGGRRFGWQLNSSEFVRPEDYSNTKELGRLIYTEYVYAFEIAAVILLVAIVAAIALTLRGRKDTKQVDPVSQIKVKREDRVKLVSIPSGNPGEQE